MAPPPSTFSWICWICMDILGTILESIVITRPPIHTPSDIDDIVDIKRVSDRGPHGMRNVKRIAENTIVKYTFNIDEDVEYPSEALALQLVGERTSIPVPRIRRVWREGRNFCIAMEYIPGKQLSVVWPTLSWHGRLKIAFKIRSYIRQLRTITHSVPGPVGGPRTCRSPLFGPVVPYRGPFSNYSEFTRFFNHKYEESIELYGQPLPSLRGTTFDDSGPLVLTHQDLNPRNFIVGDDGYLWLVDWTWAGFYPRWFEFVAMRRQADVEEHLMKRVDSGWQAMIPFVCGWFFQQEEWISYVSRSLTW